MKLLDHIKAARRVSVPLIFIRTPDPAATVRAVGAAINGKAPLLEWDCVNGLRALNEAGQAALVEAVPNGDAGDIGSPLEALRTALTLPEQAALFMYNLNRYLESPAVVQAIWNLRDKFKTNRRTLIAVVSDVTLPAELANDVLILDEPYPTPDELSKIICDQYEAASLAKPKPPVLEKAVDAVAGLASFPTEQEVAMSLSKDGLNMDELWERKRQKIEQTKGLSVWRGGETFKDVVGISNVTTFLGCLAAKGSFGAIVFLDEIEKMLAGAEGDTSGTSQAQSEAFLAWSQNTRALGVILTGIAGSGKSLTAKATGGEAGKPVVMFSTSALKGSLVGETEQNTRAAFKAVDAIAQGRVLMIATCNRMQALPPEIRSRFRLGTFFYDLPGADEQAAIWKLYRAKYGIKASEKLPAHKGWVGREIESCCEVAHLLDISLQEAAGYIVPVAQSAADEIERVRNYASGRFISASKSGVYVYSKTTAPTGRSIEL